MLFRSVHGAAPVWGKRGAGAASLGGSSLGGSSSQGGLGAAPTGASANASSPAATPSATNAAASSAPSHAPASSAPQPGATPAAAKRKLSYKEQRELEALPQRIEALEAEQKAIAAELGDGLLYARHPERASALTQRHATIEDELLQALERWEALGHTS